MAKLATNDLAGLLARFGHDIAGALVIVAEGDDLSPANAAIEECSARKLDEAVASLSDNPLGLCEDSELSIAGIQDKLRLVELEGGGWGRPVHGYPSTRISEGRR